MFHKCIIWYACAYVPYVYILFKDTSYVYTVCMECIYMFFSVRCMSDHLSMPASWWHSKIRLRRCRWLPRWHPSESEEKLILGEVSTLSWLCRGFSDEPLNNCRDLVLIVSPQFTLLVWCKSLGIVGVVFSSALLSSSIYHSLLGQDFLSEMINLNF